MALLALVHSDRSERPSGSKGLVSLENAEQKTRRTLEVRSNERVAVEVLPTFEAALSTFLWSDQGPFEYDSTVVSGCTSEATYMDEYHSCSMFTLRRNVVDTRNRCWLHILSTRVVSWRKGASFQSNLSGPPTYYTINFSIISQIDPPTFC